MAYAKHITPEGYVIENEGPRWEHGYSLLVPLNQSAGSRVINIFRIDRLGPYGKPFSTSCIANQYDDASEELVFEAEKGRVISVYANSFKDHKPEAPRLTHIKVLWSENKEALRYRPSLSLSHRDKTLHLWFLKNTEIVAETLGRIWRLLPGYDPLGTLPLPGFDGCKAFDFTGGYWTLDELEGKEPDPDKPRSKSEVFVDQVMKNLREKFKAWEHSPSRDHMAGLESIANVFSAMVTGEADAKLYLSSLPTGMGKTSTLTECTKLLCSETQETGVVIFLERLAEIRKLVGDMNLRKNQFACLTSDEEINSFGLGSGKVDVAQVLFTTQARLEAMSVKRGSFAAISEFYYRGQPRPVRVWDEAISPSKILTVDRKRVQGLFPEVPGEKLYGELDDWSIGTRTLTTGDKTTVPDINLYGADSLESWLANFSLQNRDTAEALWYLSGRTALIRRDSETSRVTLDYEDLLPQDLKPFLVLDASGGLREVYSLAEEHRGEIERLYSPGKRYSGLAVHHWNIGAGKTSQLSKARQAELLQGVADKINAIDSRERVLVLHHKPRRKALDWPRKLPPLLFRNVEMLHWGAHTATNEYADVKHVFVVGLLNYNPSQYEAQARAAKGIDHEGEITEEEFQAVRRGEIMHNLFQAVSRGAVRRAIGDECPTGVKLYIACSTHHSTGIDRGIFQEVFPGSSYTAWKREVKATGDIKRALDTIVVMLSQSNRAGFTDVREAIGMDRGNFNNRVIQHHDFAQLLAEAGYKVSGGLGRGGKWFERV